MSFLKKNKTSASSEGKEKTTVKHKQKSISKPKKEKDYVRSMGKELEIRTYRAIERQKEFYGILTAYDDNTVTIEQEDGNEITFEKADIALIRLAFDF